METSSSKMVRSCTYKRLLNDTSWPTNKRLFIVRSPACIFKYPEIFMFPQISITVLLRSLNKEGINTCNILENPRISLSLLFSSLKELVITFEIIIASSLVMWISNNELLFPLILSAIPEEFNIESGTICQFSLAGPFLVKPNTPWSPAKVIIFSSLAWMLFNAILFTLFRLETKEVSTRRSIVVQFKPASLEYDITLLPTATIKSSFTAKISW